MASLLTDMQCTAELLSEGPASLSKGADMSQFESKAVAMALGRVITLATAVVALIDVHYEDLRSGSRPPDDVAILQNSVLCMTALHTAAAQLLALFTHGKQQKQGGGGNSEVVIQQGVAELCGLAGRLLQAPQEKSMMWHVPSGHKLRQVAQSSSDSSSDADAVIEEEGDEKQVQVTLMLPTLITEEAQAPVPVLGSEGGMEQGVVEALQGLEIDPSTFFPMPSRPAATQEQQEGEEQQQGSSPEKDAVEILDELINTAAKLGIHILESMKSPPPGVSEAASASASAVSSLSKAVQGALFVVSAAIGLQQKVSGGLLCPAALMEVLDKARLFQDLRTHPDKVRIEMPALIFIIPCIFNVP